MTNLARWLREGASLRREAVDFVLSPAASSSRTRASASCARRAPPRARRSTRCSQAPAARGQTARDDRHQASSRRVVVLRDRRNSRQVARPRRRPSSARVRRAHARLGPAPRTLRAGAPLRHRSEGRGPHARRHARRRAVHVRRSLRPRRRSLPGRGVRQRRGRPARARELPNLLRRRAAAVFVGAAGYVGSSIDTKEAEARLFTLVNQDRRAAGLPALAPDSALAASRASTAWTCSNTTSWGTSRRGRVGPAIASRRRGSPPSRASENVGRNGSVEELELGLMASPGHRSAILDPLATAWASASSSTTPERATSSSSGRSCFARTSGARRGAPRARCPSPRDSARPARRSRPACRVSTGPPPRRARSKEGLTVTRTDRCGAAAQKRRVTFRGASRSEGGECLPEGIRAQGRT